MHMQLGTVIGCKLYMLISSGADGIPYPRLHHTKVRSRFAPEMDFDHSVPHSR